MIIRKINSERKNKRKMVNSIPPMSHSSDPPRDSLVTNGMSSYKTIQFAVWGPEERGRERKVEDEEENEGFSVVVVMVLETYKIYYKIYIKT